MAKSYTELIEEIYYLKQFLEKINPIKNYMFY